jgi:hypothetical protein
MSAQQHVSASSMTSSPAVARKLRIARVEMMSQEERAAREEAMIRALRSQQSGFVQVSSLPQAVSPTRILLTDEDGALYEMGVQNGKPVVQPYVPWSPETEKRPDASGTPRTSTDMPTDGPQGSASNDNTAAGGRSPGTLEATIASVGQQLATQFVTDLASGKGLSPQLLSSLSGGNLISSLGSQALSGLTNMLMGSLMGSLLGKVDDSSSLGTQLAAKIAPQLMGQVQSQLGSAVAGAMNPGAQAGPGMAEKIDRWLNGVRSTANIPLGQGLPGGGDKHVTAQGKSATRVGDEAIAGSDVGKYLAGHPTILINGKQAVGKPHTTEPTKPHGLILRPKELAAKVVMGKPPAPPPAKKTFLEQKNDAQKIIGETCNPTDAAQADALAENEDFDNTGDGIGRPLICKADPDNPELGVVSRPDAFEPPELLKSLLGFENTPIDTGTGEQIDNWSILWGAISLGSPQQPGAGALGSWGVPDTLFGHDMSPYFLRHDSTFRDDKTLGQMPDILGVEADAFAHGVAGNSDLSHLPLQLLYSLATTTVGVGHGVVNTASGRPRA